jgi:hypothetical protein
MYIPKPLKIHPHGGTMVGTKPFPLYSTYIRIRIYVYVQRSGARYTCALAQGARARRKSRCAAIYVLALATGDSCGAASAIERRRALARNVGPHRKNRNGTARRSLGCGFGEVNRIGLY